MGAWGPAVFSDDTACDVRDGYMRLLGEGLDGAEATDRLIKEFTPDPDPEVGPVFWVALAITQWKCGRLGDAVKRRALEAIDDGSALGEWSGTSYESRRRKALRAARERLESPQPPERTIRRFVPAICEWERGQLIAFRLLSGRYVVLRMADTFKDAGGTYPVCELLDWMGEEVPADGVSQRTPVLKTVRDAALTLAGAIEWMIIPPTGRRRMGDRVVALDARHKLGRGYKPAVFKDRRERTRRISGQRSKASELVVFWSTLDAHLSESYGLT